MSLTNNDWPLVELVFDVTVSDPAASVVLDFWRLSDGRADMFFACTYTPGTDITTHHDAFFGNAIAVRVRSFVNGTNPTASGAVYARPIAGSATA